jgi:hypothetical protein
MTFASVRTVGCRGARSARAPIRRAAHGVHLLQVHLDAIAAHHTMAVEKRAALRNRTLHDRDPGYPGKSRREVSACRSATPLTYALMLSARRVRLIVCTCELSKHRGLDERTGHGLDQIVGRLRERSRTWHCFMQSSSRSGPARWQPGRLDIALAATTRSSYGRHGEAAKLDAPFMEGLEKAL